MALTTALSMSAASTSVRMPPVSPQTSTPRRRYRLRGAGSGDRRPGGPSGNDVTMVDPGEVLHSLGVRARRVTTLKDRPGENANWLVDTAKGERVVLRRYH